MQFLRKRLTIGLAIALVVGLVTTGMIATPAIAEKAEISKSRKLPAAKSPPPDVAEREKKEQEAGEVPEPPKGRASVKDLEEKVRGRPGGNARLEKAKGKKKGDKVHPASATPPPDVAEREKEEKERGKVPDPPKRKGKGPGSLLSRLNPFRVTDVWAGETLTITLSPEVDTYGRHASLYSSSPYAKAHVYGGHISNYYPNSEAIQLHGSNIVIGDVTSTATNPFVYLRISIPTAGWYIVNIRAYAYYAGDIVLKHYEAPGYPTIATFSTPHASPWEDYPELLYLEPGSHYFYWVFTGNTGLYAHVSDITVDSYP